MATGLMGWNNCTEEGLNTYLMQRVFPAKNSTQWNNEM